jgi:capsular exopolysaccharide synthesis family protein
MRAPMSLMHFWRVFRHWWWLPLAAALIIGAAGYLSGKSMPPVYQTSVRLLVNNVQTPGPPSYDDTIASASLANTYSQLLQSPAILQRTIDSLRLSSTPARLGQQVDVQVVRNTPLLDIVVQDGNPARAAAIANALARDLTSYVARLQTRPAQPVGPQATQQIASLRRSIANATDRRSLLRVTIFPNTNTVAQIQQTQAEIDADQNRLNTLLDAQRQSAPGRAQTTSTVTSLGPAQVPSTPIQPQPLRTLALAALIGFLLGFAAAVLLDLLDDRVRQPGDLDRLFGVAPLGVVGAARGLVPTLMDASPLFLGPPDIARLTDDLLLVRANLDAGLRERPAVLCVSSAGVGDGKSTIAANLALLEAQAGKRVILVDANLRDPHVHILFDLPNDWGLSEYLAPKSVGAPPPLQDGPLNVKVLTAGPLSPNPAALLGSRQMAELVHLLRAGADLVILDTAPIGQVPDTILLQGVADGTLLVVDARRARMASLRDALTSIRRASGTVTGFIINKSGQPARRTGWPIVGQSAQQATALPANDPSEARVVSSWVGQ